MASHASNRRRRNLTEVESSLAGAGARLPVAEPCHASDVAMNRTEAGVLTKGAGPRPRISTKDTGLLTPFKGLDGSWRASFRLRACIGTMNRNGLNVGQASRLPGERASASRSVPSALPTEAGETPALP